MAQAIGRNLPIFGGTEIIGHNLGRILEIGRADLHLASAGWVEIADAHGNGGKVMEIFAKGLQAQRLHMVFEVGMGAGKIRAGEGAQLTGRHAHWTRAVEQIFGTDFQPPKQAIGQRVECLCPIDLENYC